MAKNVIINGISYTAVPYINVPLSTGNGNATFYDTSNATASASSILNGFSAYTASGLVNGSATMPTVSQDSTTKVLTIS